VHGTGGQVWGDGYVPRLNGRSRPGIMRALGPSDLFTEEKPRIPSVIVDARLALDDHDISAELRDRGIDMIVDTQGWRYSDPRTWETAWNSVSYAPPIPFNAQHNWVHEYALKDLSAQFNAGCSCLMLPGWFSSLETSKLAEDVAVWTLEAFEDFKHKIALAPAIAWLPAKSGAPDATLAAAKVYAQSGAVHAVYVQRDKVDGPRDPLDRLKRSAKLMLEIQNFGLPVIAGHFGCMGLTIRAIGISAADCGPCEDQSFDFLDAIRSAVPQVREDTARRSGPPAVRMWLDELGQTVTARQMAAIRQDRAALAEIMCRRECHRFRLGRDTMSVAVHHGVLSLCEAATRQSRLPASMRVDNARRLLTAMKTRIGIMDAALSADHQPLLRQSHLDVQLALLADVNSLHGVA
jgi:hypothetical protein